VVAVTKRRRSGWIAAAAGVLLLAAAARLSPVWHAPLYDGIVIEDPYRYLEPPTGKPGDPTSVSDTLALDQGVSPQLYSGTLETPPQAQMIADRDAFQLPSGTTSIKSSIAAIKPPAPIAEGRISGNVYRFAVVNQAGTDLSLLPGTTITIVLRAPNNVANGTIIHFDGTSWQKVPTDNGGLIDMYATNATELGDYAVLVTGAQTPEPSGLTPPPFSTGPSPSPTPSPTGGQTPWLVIGLVAAAILVGVLWRTLGDREP
jgi:hypothetical protein